MVEPDLVDEHPLRLDAEPARDPALERDRDVAEADGALAVVEERPRHDPDRVREVDDPGFSSRPLANPLRDLEHHRDGPHRLREAARARGLLADAAAAERHGLVPEARLLPADADLDQDEVGALDGRVEIAAERELAGVPLAVEHPSG